jgi:hypothetical protein
VVKLHSGMYSYHMWTFIQMTVMYLTHFLLFQVLARGSGLLHDLPEVPEGRRGGHPGGGS